MQKNKAGKWIVYAYDTSTNLPVTGDAANITADVYIDGVSNAIDDTSPIELSGGYYIFDLTSLETNGDSLLIVATSTTGSVRVIGKPEALYTEITEAIQDQIGRLTSGSAAINTIAGSFVKAGAEPETNTYLSTRELDGVLHIVEDDAGSTDAYYEFNVGGNGVPVEINWEGYTRSNGDSYSLFAYNYSTSSYEQIGSVLGSNGTTIIKETFSLTNAHVGAGADIGKVRFRFLSVDGTDFATDRILCSYAIVAQSVGYDGGQVWIDTVNGTAGTESFVNGTADNPSLTLVDASIIAGNVGLSSFNVSSGSTITLAQDYTNATATIYGATLNLNGKDISDTYTWGGIISGISIGTGPIHFTDSEIRGATLPPVHMQNCSLSNTIIAQRAGTYIFSKCYSQVSGIDSPVFDFAGVGNVSLNMRSYSGGIEVQNMSAGDVMSLEGDGQLIINANCTGGTIVCRGNFTFTDNAGGAVTHIEDDKAIMIEAIKEKTDDLAFTKANELDSNIQSINGVAITGDGGVEPFDV